MADSLKQKTIAGVSWSFVEQILTRGVNFVIGILLARILSPTDYGLVGMLAVFIAVSQIFIDGGLISALIREKSPSQEDLSTVYLLNMGLSVVFYFILFFSAPLVSGFYEQPILCPLLRVVALGLVISSVASVHNTLLSIRVDFRTKSLVSFCTALFSGIAGIVCAYRGMGVWALAAQTLAAAAVSTLLLLVLVRWKPSLVFSRDSFRRLFSYSSKLLVTNLVRTLFDNINSLVIGKRFSAASLGQYSRAGQFPGVANSTISSALNQVAFPVLCKLQDDDERLLRVYEKYIQLCCFIIFPVMLGLCGCAKPLVLLLLTDKWLECVPLMQILCIALLTDCVTHINLDLLFAKGRTDIVLRLELVKKVIAFIILLATMFISLEAICIGQVVNAFVALYINTFYTKKILGYGLWAQVKVMVPYLLCALVVLAEGLLFSHLIQSTWLSLLVSMAVCIPTYWLLVKVTGLYAYQETLTLVKERLSHRKEA